MSERTFPTENGGLKRILIVDDHSLVRMGLATVLSPTGMHESDLR